MIKKKIYPVFEKTGASRAQEEETAMVTKMITEYRLFGILLYKKELYTPAYYGERYFDNFYTSF